MMMVIIIIIIIITHGTRDLTHKLHVFQTSLKKASSQCRNMPPLSNAAAQHYGSSTSRCDLWHMDHVGMITVRTFWNSTVCPE